MGKVFLVGAGPGDPELLTVKAVKILSCADVVLHDDLVSSEVLELVPPRAERVDVGKRCGRKCVSQEMINALLVSRAAVHDVVVRLKGGDPLIFGRAGEEIDALRAAGVDFQIVPGITAGLGAAAVAGISLTRRGFASQVTFTTAQREIGSPAPRWSAFDDRTTLVIYMPGTDYGAVAWQLREAGWPSDVPCLVVSGATRTGQQLRFTNLADLPDEDSLPAPTLLIAGRVTAREALAISGHEGAFSGEMVAAG